MIRRACCYLVGLVCLLVSPGCALLDPGPPMTNVLLPVEFPQPSDDGRLPVQILVTRPATDGATGTDRIIALMHGYEIRALDSAKWVSPVPFMVQRQVVDALEATRRLAAVGWENSSLDQTFRLATDIRRFFLRYDAQDSPPTADIVLVFSLIRTETGDVVARRFVRAEEPCASDTLNAFVTAFGQGMTRILAQTSEWVIANLEKQLVLDKAGKKNAAKRMATSSRK